MNRLDSFLSPEHTSLKVCGVTLPHDAEMLADLGVDAMGVNFWPNSKRYLPPEQAGWLAGFADKILRVGVFVNADPGWPVRLVREGCIDMVQFHGDETPEEVRLVRDAGIPFIKAVGVRNSDDLAGLGEYGADAVLLDAHAPGLYGGTGRTMDWSAAARFRLQQPDLPLILAGGVIPGNAACAVEMVRPAALDTASGVELSPGVKDREKVLAMLTAIRRHDD